MPKTNSIWNWKPNSWFRQTSKNKESNVESFSQKLVRFFSWFSNSNLEIKSPVQVPSHERFTDGLMGKAFHFTVQNSDRKVNSPLTGNIERIFNGRAVLIRTRSNLQIILSLNSTEEDYKPEEEAAFNLVVKKDEQIAVGERIFSIREPKFLEAVVYIPWQPNLIKKIDGVKIYFKNPFGRLITGLHGIYI